MRINEIRNGGINLKGKSNRNIKIIGIGSGACNCIGYLEKNYKMEKNVKLIGSDSSSCGMRECKNKLPLTRVYPNYLKVKRILEEGEQSTRDIMCCIGCIGNEYLGELSARSQHFYIEKELNDSENLIFVSYLGGGTGIGATKYFINVANEMNIQSTTIVIMPYTFMGKRKERALKGLKEIKKITEKVIVYDLDDILLPKKCTINKAFYLADEKAAELILQELNKMNVVYEKMINVEETEF